MPGYLPGQQLRLIESAVPAFAPVQRNGDNGVEPFVYRNGTFQKCRKRFGQGFHPGILVEMNEIAERAFVESEAGGAVESAKAGLASCADAKFI